VVVAILHSSLPSLALIGVREAFEMLFWDLTGGQTLPLRSLSAETRDLSCASAVRWKIGVRGGWRMADMIVIP
jgi:hypothetical protein